MAVTFTSTMSGASADYERYLGSLPVKTMRYKDSTLFDFTLIPLDTSFVKLHRGAYISFSTTTYPKWFTGYILNEPEPEYLGKDSTTKQPIWGYKYQATSDEYILSVKPIGIIPPFLNMTWGAILKSLAERLMPGTFDVTGIQDGPLVSQYVVEPDKKFFDVQQDACESSSFTFWANDKKLYFKSQDDASLGSFTLDKSNTHFTPARLSIKPVNSGSGVINDVTVLGDIEPQTYVHEYFVGTGLDGSFPLLTGVYGADTSVLLDEGFSGAAVDSSKWRIYDTPSNFLQVSNGYLNTLGGTGTGAYDVRIEATNPIPLDGRLRFTHGDWDFLAGNGFIAGLWTATPSAALTGCVYCLKITGTTINPVIGGVLDSTQSITTSTTKRYVIRTIAEFEKTDRKCQQYNYLNAAGAVASYGGTTKTDNVTWDTLVSEVDPTNGDITNQWRFVNSSTVSTDVYATYIPVASNTLQCAFTGVTISVPIAATLEKCQQLYIGDGAFAEWDSSTQPTLWPYAVNAHKETTYADAGFAAKLSPDGTGIAYVEQPITDLVLTGVKYNGIVRLRKTVGMTAGTLKVFFAGTGVADPGISVPVSSILDSGYTTFTGVLAAGLTTIPSDLTLKVDLVSGVIGEGVYVDDIVVLSRFEKQIIGPNEIDGLDGLRPIATIVSSGNGSTSKNSYTGTPQYNPGQAQLVYFKDSVTLESELPPANQLVRLSYRGAGPAIGRALSRASIEAEGAQWLDDGVRSVVRSDIVPRPRNSEECELAASALVAENAANHYDGTYEQFSTYFTAEPKPGGTVTFVNLAAMADVAVEEINQVATTLLSKRPNELFNHVVSFGKPDIARHILAKVNRKPSTFQRNATSGSTTAVDINAIGTIFAGDVSKPVLVGWNDDNVFIDAGQTLGANDLYFEVRYTDEGWGVDAGKNLLTRTTNRLFTVPRSRRGKVFFIRKAKTGNHILYSEDQTQSNYTGATVTRSLKLGPDSQYSQVSTVTMNAGTSFSCAISGMTGSQFCGSLSIKAPLNKAMTVSFGGMTKAVVGTGYWQRVTVSKTGTAPTFLSISYPSGSSFSLDTTRWSAEQGTLAETSYAKTAAIKYGPVSRYSSAVNIAFPSTVVSGATVDLESLMITPTY